MRSRALRLPAVAVLVALAVAPLYALDGVLQDEDGKGIPNAHACLVSEGLEVFCTKSGEEGRFKLPDAPAPTLRIQALGFQKIEIPAEVPEKPLVMKRAATLMLHVVDAETGEPLERAQVWLRRADGSRRGPAPVNRHGLRLGTLDPGFVRIEVEAGGYEQEWPGETMLVAGKTIEKTIKLKPVAEQQGQ